MNNKRLCMLNKELGLNDYTEVPNIQATIKNVNNSINANFTERRLYMRRKFINLALVTVLFISITSLTVIATTLGWHYKLIEYFKNSSIEQMELMNGSFDAPMVTESDNGYTVNVINTLADKHGVYVLYELILPVDKNISELNINDYMKDIVHGLYVKSKNLLNNNGAVSMGISNFKILEVQKNKITLCEYIGISSEISDECMLILSVMNNKKEASSQSDDNFNINLSWNFKYKNIGKSITVNRKLDNSGINNTTLNQIDISPNSP